MDTGRLTRNSIALQSDNAHLKPLRVLKQRKSPITQRTRSLKLAEYVVVAEAKSVSDVVDVSYAVRCVSERSGWEQHAAVRP